MGVTEAYPHSSLIHKGRIDIARTHPLLFFSVDKNGIGRVEAPCRNILFEFLYFYPRFAKAVKSIESILIIGWNVSSWSKFKTTESRAVAFYITQKVCVHQFLQLGQVLCLMSFHFHDAVEISGCVQGYWTLDVFLGAAVSVKGQSLTPNPVFKLLVGLAGVCWLGNNPLGVIRVCNWWWFGWWRWQPGCFGQLKCWPGRVRGSTYSS